jgi:hypothetical protein
MRILTGVAVSRKIPPPPGGQGISANVIWGKKYESGREKRGNVQEKGKKGKKKEE